MALIAFDGFDQYAAGPGAPDQLNACNDILSRRGGGFQWNILSGYNHWVSPGRNDVGQAIAMGHVGLSELSGTVSNPAQTLIFGVAFKMVANVPPNYLYNPRIALSDSLGGVQVSLVINSTSNGMDIYNGGDTGIYGLGFGPLIGRTQNNAFSFGIWNYLEIRAFIHPTAGSIIVRNNGVVVGDLQNVNTNAVPNRPIMDTIAFFSNAVGGDTFITLDDFYVADTTPGPGAFDFSTFAGDLRVITLQTIGDAGVQWTPLAGANWQEVSEPVNDGDASYNSTATVGAQDLFNVEALPASVGTVLAVQVIGAYRKDDAGIHTVQQHMITSGFGSYGANQSVPPVYAYVYDLWTTCPATGTAWSPALVNATQIGYELTL